MPYLWTRYPVPNIGVGVSLTLDSQHQARFRPNLSHHETPEDAGRHRDGSKPSTAADTAIEPQTSESEEINLTCVSSSASRDGMLLFPSVRKVVAVEEGRRNCLHVLPQLRQSTGMLFGRSLPKLPLLRTRSKESTRRDETDPPSKRNDIPNTRPLGFIRLPLWCDAARLQSGTTLSMSQQDWLQTLSGLFSSGSLSGRLQAQNKAFRTSCSRSLSCLS